MKIIKVPIASVVPNPDQPRKSFSDDDLCDLKDSIIKYGVLQPLLVKRGENKLFTLIAGERRLRAANLAGLNTVPVIIKDMGNEDTAVVALVENLQRQDLNFIEEARAYKRLMDEFNMTQLEISQKVSKKQSTISNKIRVLSLPDDIQQNLLENNLSERHGRALLKLSDQDDRRKVISKVVGNNLNVKQTEKLIEDFIAGKEKAERNKRQIRYISYKIYMNTIKKAFNQVKTVEKGAKIIENDMGEYMELKIIIPKNERCFT